MTKEITLHGQTLRKANSKFDKDLCNDVKNNDSEGFLDKYLSWQEKYPASERDSQSPNQDLISEEEKSLVMIAVENAITNPEYITILDTLIFCLYQTNILDATNRTPLHGLCSEG